MYSYNDYNYYRLSRFDKMNPTVPIPNRYFLNFVFIHNKYTFKEAIKFMETDPIRDSVTDPTKNSVTFPIIYFGKYHNSMELED